MLFVFDTGASVISISIAEATFLYKQVKLTHEDILGETELMDANGEINIGAKVNLREVTIGEEKLANVEAIVVDNPNAPILLGQSALSRFGKIQIDYQNGFLIIER
jgi:aspartyl protease family protein